MGALIEYCKRQDQKLLRLVNQSMSCGVLDYLMKPITQLGSLPVAIAIPLLLLLSNHSKTQSAGRAMAEILVFSQIIVHFLKWAINRPRPFNVFGSLIANRASAPGFSFPSGHTCTAVSFAISTSHFLPVPIVPMLSLAALVGFSRIYLGVHYPSDVLVGSLIAVAVFIVIV